MIAKNNHLHSFAEGFLERLDRELSRVGRTGASIEPGPNGTLTIRDRDGSWSGPAQAANIALDKCPDERGGGSDFWSRLPA